jgi:hypothetical protein
MSPCLVAANLGAVCTSTSSMLSSIGKEVIILIILAAYDVRGLVPTSGSFYTPSDAATPCECSTVTYSLMGSFVFCGRLSSTSANYLAACGLCQGGAFTSWSSWSENCGAVFPSACESTYSSRVLNTNIKTDIHSIYPKAHSYLIGHTWMLFSRIYLMPKPPRKLEVITTRSDPADI